MRSRVEELWAAYCAEGRLPAGDARALAEALEQDDGLRAAALADERLDGSLAAIGRATADGETFARQFVARLAAERDASRFVAAAELRVRAAQEAEAAAPRRRWWPLSLVLPVAAAMALVPLTLRRSQLPAARTEVTAQEQPAPAVPRGQARAKLPPVRLAGIAGTVKLLDGGRPSRALAGTALAPGHGVVTLGRDSQATLSFDDGTRLVLAGEGAIGSAHEADDAGGKNVFLARGSLTAHVPPQPAGRSLVIGTPHAVAKVMGTRFTLEVKGALTRAYVEEGRVELTRLGGGAAVVEGGQYALAGDEVTPAAHPRPRGTAILVVGSLTLVRGDQRVKERIEGLGFDVRPQGSGAPDPEELKRASIVVLSSTVSSLDVNTWYRELPVPIVVWESWLYDDLGMTGPYENGECNATVSTGEAVIKDSTHPIAAGLSPGLLQLFVPQPPHKGPNAWRRRPIMSWGVPAPSAHWIATWPGEPTRSVVFAYERGAAMPGLVAPARRVALFLQDETALTMTDAGWSLFDAALLWSVETPTSVGR